jgi:predicted  nucleic acid-binding Zn-ribbon protein
MDWDALVACPTCGHVFRPDEDDEDAHLQPCPNCGWTLMLVSVEIWDDGDHQVSVRWNKGEGAPLFLEDATKAISLAEKFWDREEAEEDRIEDALTQMRHERQLQEED